MTYEQPVAGGVWEHRSGDCLEHGDNVPFARPYKTLERYQCAACLLICAKFERLRSAPPAPPKPVHERRIFDEEWPGVR